MLAIGKSNRKKETKLPVQSVRDVLPYFGGKREK